MTEPNPKPLTFDQLQAESHSSRRDPTQDATRPGRRT